jgi:hypothetical protein
MSRAAQVGRAAKKKGSFAVFFFGGTPSVWAPELMVEVEAHLSLIDSIQEIGDGLKVPLP